MLKLFEREEKRNKMSFQWSLIAAFLFAEIVLVIFLLLPFKSAQKWQKLLNYRFSNDGLTYWIHIYFYVLLDLVFLCLLDAIRQMWKFDREEVVSSKNPSLPHQNLDQELRNHMVLFRAQRNFYITGFSLFFAFVIRRLMTLLVTISTLEATNEANMRQAQLMKELMNNKQPEEGDDEKNKKELAEEAIKKKKKDCVLKEEVLAGEEEEEEEELTRSVKNAEAMKSPQADISRMSVNYGTFRHRLMEDEHHDRLQNRLQKNRWALEDGEESLTRKAINL